MKMKKLNILWVLTLVSGLLTLVFFFFSVDMIISIPYDRTIMTDIPSNSTNLTIFAVVCTMAFIMTAIYYIILSEYYNNNNI